MRSELFSMERILGICEKICYFFIINLLFITMNIPVLLFFLFVGISQVRTYLPLFLLCLVWMPPALSAVFYAMNRLLGGIEGNPCKDYFRGYKMDFWQKIRLGLGQLFVVFILWTNIEFFSKQLIVTPLVILFSVLFLFTLILTPSLYLLVSKYEMSNAQIVKTACALTVARPICTLGNVAALGISLMAFELVAGTAVLFMVSAYGFLVVFINQKMMKDLEKSQ